MVSGLESTSNLASSPDKDPAYAKLHAQVFAPTRNAFRLADSPDFTPGPAGTPDGGPNPGVRLADAPPPIVATNERPNAVVAPGAVSDNGAAPAVTKTEQGQPNPNPNPEVQSGPAPAAATGNCAPFNYGDSGTAADDPKISAWRPNPNSTSQLTKDWFAAKSQLAGVAPEDGAYTVKFGDCLESIAKRELKKENKATDGNAIKAEVAKIIALNHDHYKSLDTNSEFIKDGWKLKLNDCAPAPAAPPPEAPPPAPAPEKDCKAEKVCPGEGPAHVEPTNRPRGRHAGKEDCADVIVVDTKGQIFYNGNKVGDHDKVVIKNGVATEYPNVRGPEGEGPRVPAPPAKVEAPPPAPASTKVTEAGTFPVLPDDDQAPPPVVAARPPARTEGPAIKQAQTTSEDDLTPGPAAAAEVAPPVVKQPPRVVASPAPAKADDKKEQQPGSDFGPV